MPLPATAPSCSRKLPLAAPHCSCMPLAFPPTGLSPPSPPAHPATLLIVPLPGAGKFFGIRNGIDPDIWDPSGARPRLRKERLVHVPHPHPWCAGRALHLAVSKQVECTIAAGPFRVRTAAGPVPSKPLVLFTGFLAHSQTSCRGPAAKWPPLLTSPAPPLLAPHAEDPLLPLGYTAESVVEGKAAAKAELRKRMQLSNAGRQSLVLEVCIAAVHIAAAHVLLRMFYHQQCGGA